MKQEAPSPSTFRVFTCAALVLTLAAASTSCATSPKAASSDASRASSPEKTFFDPPYVRGIVVDEDGSPVKAHVAVVRKNGSNSTTGTGRFTLPTPKSGSATLVATTEDGRIAWRTIAAGDEGPFTLVTDQSGAFLELELGGDNSARIAVFHGDVRLHDMTLHPHKAQTLVVPVGHVRFGVTIPETQLREASLTEGQRVYVQLP
jgi:hypothetical protein